MKLGIRRALLMGLALLGMLSVEAAPAGAVVTVNAGVFVVEGRGTIAPGLTPLPQQQFFTFTSFNVTGAGTVHKRTVTPTDPGSSCAANGLDGLVTPVSKGDGKNGWPGDSSAVGTGLGTWSCSSGPLAGKSGLLYYTRVGPVVTVLLTNNTPGPLVFKLTPFGVLVCLFVPDQPTPPTTSYELHCVGGAADVLTLPV